MRTQGVIRFEMPDDELAHDHPARVLWLALGKLDLSALAAPAPDALTADAADAVDVRDLARRGRRANERSRAEHQLIEARPP